MGGRLDKLQFTNRRKKKKAVDHVARTVTAIEEAPKPPKVAANKAPELLQQISEAQKDGDLLPFLEDAIQQPVFRLKHATLAIGCLSEVKRQAFERVFQTWELEGNLAIELLAVRTRQLLLQDGSKLGTKDIANLWYNIAFLGEELPIISENLAKEVANMVLSSADAFDLYEEVRIMQANAIIWGWLGKHHPKLQARILKPFFAYERFTETKMRLKPPAMRNEAVAYYRALHHLNKQEPELQLPLYPNPKHKPKIGEPLPINVRRIGKKKRETALSRAPPAAPDALA